MDEEEEKKTHWYEIVSQNTKTLEQFIARLMSR